MPTEELPPETFTGASSADREQLRTTFGQVPELYDRARPPYPQQIFEDLVELAGCARGLG